MIRQSEKDVKILIVDDAPDNLLLLEAILESEGFNNVILANSAEEAYKKLKTDHILNTDEISLILMDIMMPKITGIEAARHIKKQKSFSHIPIIMVSAKSEGKDLLEAFRAGAIDYVTKPINELELMARVSTALRLGRAVSARKKHENRLIILSEELAKKNVQLEKVLEGIKNDLKAAGEMQKDLLPSQDQFIDGINFKFLYDPCEHIGGDTLGITSLNDNYIAFYVIDVSGHGIKAAMTAVSIHHLLSSWAGERNILMAPDGCPRSPSYVASELNKEFSNSKSKDTQYFTMVYGLIDKKMQKVRYVRAGHPEPIMQKKNGKTTIVRNGSRPIGMIDDTKYEQIELDFNKGDRLIVYSDGITEAQNNISKDFFGESRLVSILEKTKSFPISEIPKQISTSLSKWIKASKPADDVALIIIELL